MTDTAPTYSEKDIYTKDELYALLTACESRTRTDLIYHCRKAAEEMENEAAATDDQPTKLEITNEAAVLRSMQSLATRAEEDVKALG